VLIVSQAGVAGTHGKNRDADEVKHHGWHVEHVVRPVAPAGKESVEVPEDFFCPEINAAFPRIPVSQFDDSYALRPEKEEQGNHPEPHGDAAVGSNAGHDVQVEYSNHEEQNQVEAAEYALQVRLVRVLGVG